MGMIVAEIKSRTKVHKEVGGGGGPLPKVGMNPPSPALASSERRSLWAIWGFLALPDFSESPSWFEEQGPFLDLRVSAVILGGCESRICCYRIFRAGGGWPEGAGHFFPSGSHPSPQVASSFASWARVSNATGHPTLLLFCPR